MTTGMLGSDYSQPKANFMGKSALIVLSLIGVLSCINQDVWWPLAFLTFEIIGIIIQRGFFHYHYIALTPGLAILSAFGLASFGSWMQIVAIILLLSLHHSSLAKT